MSRFFLSAGLTLAIYAMNSDIREKDICYIMSSYSLALDLNFFSHYQSYSNCVSVINQVLTPFRYFQNTSYILRSVAFSMLWIINA